MLIYMPNNNEAWLVYVLLQSWLLAVSYAY